MPILLYSFQDQTTGEIRDVRAPSEDAARTTLGGIWTDRTRAASWTACEPLPSSISSIPASLAAALVRTFALIC